MRMKHPTIAAAILLTLASLAPAQRMQAPPSSGPRISYVMPMGGQAGSTFDFSVAGQDMNDVLGLHFNFPGVKVEPGSSESTNVPKMGKGKNAQPNALTTQRFKVTLPADAPLGIQDVRIVTKAGISNPRAFVVSDQKEFAEQEPNDDVSKAQRIELNSSVSGVISTPTDVDYYVFAGKKGQRVVCSCLASSVDSRLPASIQLYGADGSYLGNNRNYSQNDALLDATLPADGDYFVRVFSFSYTTGGIDHFYRLTVTTAPWIDAIFPPVVEPGKATQVTVYGRNLPGGKLDPNVVVNERILETAVITVKTPNDAKALQRLAYTGMIQPISSMLDGFDQRVKNPSGSSNGYLMTYAPAPVVLDNGANGDKDKAQQVPVPCVIAGRIDKKGDRDWYAFTAKKGQVLYLEAFAERLGSQMDLLFQVRDAQNNLITEQDDTPEILSTQFYTRSDDPSKYRFAAPADGTYYLLVTSRDAFTQYGPRFIYTVRITADEPDFRLIAMPTSLSAPEANVVNQAGGTAYNVYVWRFGGFNEEITLSGDNLPPGVGVRPQVIASSQKQAVVVVHADADAKSWAGGIQIVGTATVAGKKLTREVRAASVSWSVVQVNTPTLTRLDRELVVAVRDKAAYTLVVGTQKIDVKQGEKISIPVKLVGNDSFKTSVTIAPIGGPPGLIAQNVVLTPGQDGNVTLDIKGGLAVPPGNYTVFLRGQTQPINPKQQPQPKGGPPNIVQISMPVSVTVAPKQLGKLSVQPAAPKAPVGKELDVTVRLARQFDLPLSLKVEAILPPNVKGVSAKDVTIKAGEDEAKLTFVIAPDSTIGQSPVITIRATAMFNDSIPVVHETKVTLTITK